MIIDDGRPGRNWAGQGRLRDSWHAQDAQWTREQQYSSKLTEMPATKRSAKAFGFGSSAAAAVESLRVDRKDSRRTPFKWSAVARFMELPVIARDMQIATAQMAYAERGSVTAVVHLVVMVVVTGVRSTSLLGGYGSCSS